ncbi:MAG: metallophosphatase family protein [Nitrococcus sp.]|nr:metallophosphatase family protein [Nitrococcus sp.]
MRVAILADTHGFLDPRIRDRVSHCDVAIHAGDIGGADVLLSMQPREQVVAIRGNNDTAEKWPVAEHQMLATLPQEASVELPGGLLIVVHGDDPQSLQERHRRYRRRFAHARAVVYGHSHRLLTDFEEQPWILNPGAAGRTRTYGGPSCLFIECGPSVWQVETLRLEPRKYPSIRGVPRRLANNAHSQRERN